MSRIKLITKYKCVICNKEFDTALEGAEHKCEDGKKTKPNRKRKLAKVQNTRMQQSSSDEDKRN